MELDKANNNLRNVCQIESELNQEMQIDSNIEGFVEVTKTYTGEETDNIMVTVDNDKNTISATLKPIQFVSRETFPETGSDRLLYIDTSENAIYRWNTELNDYVLVGKDYTLDIISFRHDIGQNQMDISANRQSIADNKNEIDRLEREKITQTQMEDYTYDKQTIDDAIDDLDSDFTNLNQRVTDLEDEVETNTADIASNRSLIEANSQSIQQNKDAIETNSRSIIELQDESGNSIEVSVDPATFILTLNLKNRAGEIISTGNVDLPLETMVVSASYKDGALTLTLQNGQTLDIDISSIVDGLVNQQAFDDEITRLDGEITTLQGEVTAHDLTLTAIEEANKDRDTKINALETKSAEHEQELADYEKRIGDAELDIDNLMTQYEDLNEDTQKNTADIQGIKDTYATKQYVDENGGKIDSISVNGLKQTIDENKNVDISVPTTLAELSDDETHRLVTDDEKTEWSGKQDKLIAGENITISDDGTISSTVSGGIEIETDPTVPQHVKDITEQDITNWNDKISQGQLENYAYDKSTVDSKFSTTNSNVSDLNTKYTTLETQVSNNTKSIEGHITDITGLKSGLETANSNITDLQGTVQTAQGDMTDLQADVSAIQEKIPTQASATNQLVDRNLLNSTANSLAAFYITKSADGDPFATNAELLATTTFYNGANVRVPTTNDYAIVQADETKADELGDHPTTRYSYQGGTYPNGKWVFQYIVNRTALTAAQIAAINSNITAELTAQIMTNKNNIAGKANQSDLTALTTRVTAAETKNASQDTEIAKKANTTDLQDYIPKTDIKTMSAVGDAGYEEPADRQKVISVEALSWWNGAYMGENSNLQYFKNGEIAGKDEIPRPLWMADSITLEDKGIEEDYTIPKKNISLLAANGYTIKGSDKIIFSTTKATYLGVVKSTTDTDAVVTPKFDMATVGYVDQNAGKGGENAVLYTEQTLTSDQQTQARKNIGAGTSNFDGKYGSLSGTPSLGSLASKNSITSAEITDGTIVNADISASAAIEQSKIANLTTDLAAKATTTALNAVKTTADNAMPKSGGQFTGQVSWNATSLPENNKVPYFFLTIDGFDNGGKTYFTSVSSAKTSLGVTAVETKNASQDTAIAKAQSTADGKVSKSGDTMTGSLTINKSDAPQISLNGGDINYDATTDTFYFDGNVDLGDMSSTIAKLVANMTSVELIYDMDSSDANINKGFTTGIKANNSITYTGDYETLRIYASINTTGEVVEVPVKNRSRSEMVLTGLDEAGTTLSFQRVTFNGNTRKITVGFSYTYKFDSSTSTWKFTRDYKTSHFITRIEGIKRGV